MSPCFSRAITTSPPPRPTCADWSGASLPASAPTSVRSHRFSSAVGTAPWDKVPDEPRQAGHRDRQADLQGIPRRAEWDRWQRLANSGARAQRLLFASTGVKQKASDILYIGGLAAPNTVNTMPEETFSRSAITERRLPRCRATAANSGVAPSAHAKAGVDLPALAVAAAILCAKGFVDSWRELLAAIDAKSKTLVLTLGQVDHCS